MLETILLGLFIIGMHGVTCFIYLLESIKEKNIPLFSLAVLNLSIVAAFIYELVKLERTLN